MPGHHTVSYLRVRPQRPPRTPENVGAGHDHHDHHPHPRGRYCRRRRGAAVHRRPGQAPQPGPRPDHHDRVEGPPDDEGAVRLAVAGRHHRHLPASGDAGRSTRPDRVPHARHRLSRHGGRRAHRSGRRPRHSHHLTRLRERRPRRGRSRRPCDRRPRPDPAPHLADGHRLPGRQCALRHRALPRQRPRPVGRRAPRRRRRRNSRHPGGSAGQLQALRHPDRYRPGRPRPLLVARPASPGCPDGAQLCDRTARPGRPGGCLSRW